MLFKGCKIGITKSLATKKQQPKVGSEGFLSGLYLLPGLKVGIGNAYFFKYGNESPCRVERRSFCVDMGMDKDTAYTLNKKRTKLEVLSFLLNQEREIVNLFPSYVSYEECCPSIAYWSEPLPCKKVEGTRFLTEVELRILGRHIKSKHQKQISTGTNKKDRGMPYLPIVDFKITPHVENITSYNKYEFKSWFDAVQSFVLPFLSFTSFHSGFGEDILESLSVIAKIDGVSSAIPGDSNNHDDESDGSLAWYLQENDYTDISKRLLAFHLRKLQSLNRIFIESAEDNLIRHLSRSEVGWHDLIKVIFGKTGSRRFTSEFGGYNGQAKNVGLALRSYLVRTVLFGNIDYQINKLGKIRFFRNENIPLIISNMRAIALNLRREVPSSIAALNRLMTDRGLLN